MPRRMATLLPFAALALFAGATGTLAQETTAPLAVGQACGNADTCVEGAICTLNVCVAQDNTADVVPNGQSNRCNADDCCPTGTTCVDFYATNACWRSDAIPAFLSSVDCRGEPRTINSTSAATGALLTTPSTLDGIGDACSADVCCSGNLVCVSASNRCAPQVNGVDTVACTGTGNNNGTDTPPATDATGTDGGVVTDTSGLGQSCSADVCCDSGLVCYEKANICGPRIPGLGTVGCNGATGDDTSLTGASCSVNQACPVGETCVANYCVTDSAVPSGVSWGLGNDCSADVCCPNGYVCFQNGNRCGVRVTNIFPVVTCTENGAATSGQTITSDGQIPPVQAVPDSDNDNGNGAASFGVGATHFAVLGVAALLAALLA